MLKKVKKVLSLVLIMSMLASIIPLQAFEPFSLGMNTYAGAILRPLLPVKYDDFSNTAGIQLNADASASGGVLTVSPNNGTSFACGTAYTSEKIKLKNGDSFSTYFNFKFANGTSPAADGMTFSLQSLGNDSVGASSNRFGIYNVSPSISIEFDNWQNYDLAGSTIEPAGNHIAVFTDGDPYGHNIKTVTAPYGLNSWNSTTYHVWIDYNGEAGNLTVKMNTADDLAGATQVLTVNSLDVYSILGTDEVFAGFTGGSGDYQQNHNVYKWYMCNEYSPIDPSGAYYETTSITSGLSVVDNTETEINYTLTDHLGQPSVYEAVYFDTTGGTLSSLKEIADASGQVTVRLQSDTAVDATVTAVTDTGRINLTDVSIAGNGAMTDQKSVDEDYAALNATDWLNGNTDAGNIISDLALPTAGDNGTVIEWTSSKPDAISNVGAVTRTDYLTGDQTVSLTATVSKGSAEPKSGSFDFVVKALPMSSQEKVDADYNALTVDILLGANTSASNIVSNLTLPTESENGSAITWITTDSEVISDTGVVTRPSYSSGDRAVTLTAAVSMDGAVSKSKSFDFVVKQNEMSAADRVLDDYNWLKGQIVLNGNLNTDTVKTDLSFPTVGPNGSTVTWRTSADTIITSGGSVTHPSAVQGNKSVEAWAVVQIDNVKRQKYFIFNVVHAVATDDEAAALDCNALNYYSFLNGNPSPFSLESSLKLPAAGTYGTTITWESSETSYITNAGIVNRPAHELGFQTVQLTATVKKGSAVKTKSFVLAVRPLDDTTAPAVVSSTPSDGDTVFNDATVTIDFSEKVILADESRISVTVADENNTAKGVNYKKSIDSNKLTIEPIYEITDSDRISVSVKSGAVKDLSGNMLEDDFNMNFTRKVSRPVLSSANLQNNQKKVDINQALEFTFEDEIFIDDSQITLESIKTIQAHYWFEQGGEERENVEIAVSKDNNKLAITPLNGMIPDIQYELTILNEAVKDSAQNAMKEPIEIMFNTGSVSEINLISPRDASDTYIFGNYIRLEFDQLFGAELPQDVDYFQFGKSLFIKTDDLDTENINGIPYYKLNKLRVYSIYNHNCEVSFDSNEAVKLGTEPIRVRAGRGSRLVNTTVYKFVAAAANTVSVPMAPSSFGNEIQAPDITLDYGQTIIASDMDLISLKNPYGISADITTEIDGTKLIVRPAAGEWQSNQSYILKVSEGAVTTLEDKTLKPFEYPFKTSAKYDYTGTNIVIEKPRIAVNGCNYITVSLRNNRNYKSTGNYTVEMKVTNLTTGEVKYDKTYTYESNKNYGYLSIGDRNFSNTEVSYDTAGNYEVACIISDNSYRYEYKDTFEVAAIDDSLTELKVDRSGVVKAIDYTSFEDRYYTHAYLLNGDLPLSNRNVKFELTGKKSGKTYYSALYTTDMNGYAGFSFSLDNLPVGTFKVAFSAPGTDKSYMYYLQTEKVAVSAKLNILLYDQKTKKLIHSDPTIDIRMDNGSTIQAKRLSDWTYELNDVRPGTHSIYLYNIPYYNAKTFTKDIVSGSNKVPVYLDRYIPSSKINLSRTTSDYAENSYEDSIFIDGIDVDISFETNAYWNNHEAGQIIYEFYKGNNIKKFTTTDGKLTVNVGKLLGAGTRGRVYAVSKDGTNSDKQDIRIEVASKPSYCYVSYSKTKKQYFLNYNFSLESVGSATVPDDWPLIGGDEFALNVGKFQVGGVMDSYGKIEFAIGLSKLDFENAKIKSDYKELVKDFKAGKAGGRDSDLGFSFDTNQSWRYDTNKDSWSYVHGDYILYLEGEVSYTQYFMIAVVPAYLKGVLGVEADAKLNVDVVIDKNNNNKNLKYSGELDVAPTIEIIIGAGISGLNVEGFLNGGIDTSFTIPDFDFSATGEISGGVRATALFWSWEKKAIEYLWTIAEKDSTALNTKGSVYKVNELPSGFVFDPKTIDQADFDKMIRAESDSSSWVGYRPMLMAMGPAPKIIDSKLMQNVPDFTKTGLTAIGSKLFLVWPEDNSDRTSANRTELKYAIYDGTQWTEGKFFNIDNTGDFNPVVESTSDGAAIAWQDMNRVMTEEDQLEDYLTATEISVADYVYDSETTVTEFVYGDGLSGVSTLTDDAYYDCMPVMAYSDGKTYLAWVKNKSNNILSPEPGTFEIWYAEKFGENWSEPIALETGLNQVGDLDIAAKGNEVTVVYSIDKDGSIFTGEDVELYSKQAALGIWAESVSLTDDQVQDGNVRVMYKNNNAAAVWLKNGILTEMDIQTKEASSIKDISAQTFEILRAENGMEGLAYTSKVNDGLQSINTIFYDGSADQWSEPVEITENECVNSNLAAAVTSDDEMTVIHKAAEKITEEIDGVQYSNVGAANIEAHNMTLTKDLGVAENTIGFTDALIPGDDNEINATIENFGEFTVNNFDVVFYDGLMNQIGAASVNTPLLPGAKMIVSAVWTTPEVLTSDNITVTVDPEDRISDVDRTNNSRTEAAVACDVNIEDMKTYPIENNNYLLELKLGNYSALPAENVQIGFYHNDTLVDSQNVEIIDGGSTEVVMMELATAPFFSETNEFEGRIAIKPLGTFGNAYTANDSAVIALEKGKLAVVSSNIKDNESEIPTNAGIELAFSDSIVNSAGYGEIELTDFDGNQVPVTKEITESKLIVKPAENLDKGTYYSLTVPQNALASEYAQTLERDYTIGFFTADSDLSVTGTYPIDGSADVSTNENIAVQFNTDILKGDNFGYIELLQDDSSLVQAAISISGNKLTINPVADLKYNATYVVYIPEGAVKGENDASFEKEYEFTFTTVDGTNDEGNGNGSIHGNNTVKNAEPVTEHTIDMAQVNDNGKAFVASLSKATNTFKISADLLREMKNQNKQLIINREDIELVIEPDFADGTGQLKVTIGSRPALNEMTDTRDKVLSNIYTIDVRCDAKNYTFNGKLSAIISVDMMKINNPEKCAFFYQDEESNWQPAGGVMDAASGTMLVNLCNNRPFMAVERDITFVDVENRWSQNAIEVLAAKGIIRGRYVNRFDPTGSITRAEFTALIVRSLFEGDNSVKDTLHSENEFSDIKGDSWYAGDITKAVELNLIKGMGDGKFAPDERITREQMIAILNRLYEMRGTGAGTNAMMQNTFADFDSASDYSKEAIINMANLGIVHGSDGRIMPKDDATREASAMMIYRLLCKMGKITE